MNLKRWSLFTFSACVVGLALMVGCTSLDERQRAWIFQPTERSWGGGVEAASRMENVWIDFKSTSTDLPTRLHGLWLEADKADAPVLLYLHGARWSVTGSASRIRRMQELGFSVLGVDYRGFGKSTSGLPSEEMAYEDARAAWDWLAVNYPNRPRYIFGHSLGGPIAIDLAAQVGDERGTIVEGSFTSIADVVSTFKWGWVPVSALITQRFEAVRKVARIGSPLLVVHGDSDQLIAPDLGRKLFAAAVEPKQFLLIEGGSHHNTNAVGQPQYKQALAEFFKL